MRDLTSLAGAQGKERLAQGMCVFVGRMPQGFLKGRGFKFWNRTLKNIVLHVYLKNRRTVFGFGIVELCGVMGNMYLALVP